MSPVNNANEEYDRARKRALKEFALRRARGESGLLPVLNSKREENGVLAVIDQPMRRISLNRIIGTYQASRANSFAANFMPLLSSDTEFAYKWISLCEAHLQSGTAIRSASMNTYGNIMSRRATSASACSSTSRRARLRRRSSA